MRVGTRIKKCISYSLRQDHPHACGDKFDKTSHQHTPLGSSPCVWGQATLVGSTFPSSGIIPMRVGTRSGVSEYAMLQEDHPHACGDKLSIK